MIEVYHVRSYANQLEGLVPLEIQRSILNPYGGDGEKRVLMINFIKDHNF